MFEKKLETSFSKTCELSCIVRNHSYITSAWEGGFRKYLFLLMFSTVLTEGGVGGSEKVQKFANIIHGWSLIVSCSFVNPLRQLDPVIN